MPKLIQINVALNNGSTGKIAEGIASVARKNGWETYIVHGSRYINHTEDKAIQVASGVVDKLHYAKSLFLDGQGLGSTCATKRLVKKLEEIKPDIIHLHVIHGSYINYKVLFEYIKEHDIPVVWTLHDCWNFTGHCTYFDQVECDRWKYECHDCPQKESYPKCIGLDLSRRNFNLKKRLFTSANITMAPVSEWLSGMLAESFLKDCKRKVLHNGIDLNTFKPTESNIRGRYDIGDKHIVLGVANGFGARKGLADFLKLADMLGDEYKVVLIGVDKGVIPSLPKNIIALSRTNDQQELAEFYTAADVFANPTYEDNFPTTNLEALACGTPVITYKTGGSPEAVDYSTGVVIPQGDIDGLAGAIKNLIENPLSADACLERAREHYDKNKQFMKYIELYNSLIHNKIGGCNRLEVCGILELRNTENKELRIAAYSSCRERRMAA